MLDGSKGGRCNVYRNYKIILVEEHYLVNFIKVSADLNRRYVLLPFLQNTGRVLVMVIKRSFLTTQKNIFINIQHL